MCGWTRTWGGGDEAGVGVVLMGLGFARGVAVEAGRVGKKVVVGCGSGLQEGVTG